MQALGGCSMTTEFFEGNWSTPSYGFRWWLIPAAPDGPASPSESVGPQSPEERDNPDRPTVTTAADSRPDRDTSEAAEGSASPEPGMPVPGQEVHEVDLSTLGDQICAFAARLASATCTWLHLIAEFDRRHGWTGFKSCAHWLSWACGMAPGTAREHLRVARALESHPLVNEAFAEGALSYTKVREITRLTELVEEDVLVDLAKVATASQLARSSTAFRKYHPSRLEQERRRRVRWHVDDLGTLQLRAELPADEGALVVAAIESALDHLRRKEAKKRKKLAAAAAAAAKEVAPFRSADEAGASAAGDPRAAFDPCLGEVIDGERFGIAAADALVHLAEQYLARRPQDTSGADKHLVVLHVDAQVLADGAAADLTAERKPDDDRDAGSGADPAAASGFGAEVTSCSAAGGSAQLKAAHEAAPAERNTTAVPAAGACEVAGIGGVEDRTAARLACDAVVVALVRSRKGAVLDHGRRHRLVQPAQRRALSVRDGHCQYPTCSRVTGLHAHHVVHWSRGGPTDLDNLVLLCRYHHLMVHEGGHSISAGPGSGPGLPRWVFRDEDGDVLTDCREPSDDDLLLVDGWGRVLGPPDDPAETAALAATFRTFGGGAGFGLADTVQMLFERPRDSSAGSFNDSTRCDDPTGSPATDDSAAGAPGCPEEGALVRTAA